MPTERPTYDSKALRERDQRAEQKREKELDALQRRHEFREGATALSLFELTNHSQRLADLLGYENIHEAIADIETADAEATFRECLHRLKAAEARLDVAKAEGQISQIKLNNAEKAQRTLQTEKRQLERQYQQIQAEKKELERRYDHLADINKRAVERYKLDYKTWKNFNSWLTSDGPDQDHPDVSAEDKKRISKVNPVIMRKRQAILDGKISLSFLNDDPDNLTTPKNRPPPLGGIEMLNEGDNEVTPVSRKRPRMDEPSSANSLLKSVTNTATSSRSTTLHPTSPIPPIPIAQEHSSAPSPMRSQASNDSPCASQRIPNSSDTEEDTQTIWIPPTFKMPAPPRAGPSNLTTPATNVPSSPMSMQSSPVKKRPRKSLGEPLRRASKSPKKARRHSIHERPSNAPSDVFSSGKGKERHVEDKENASPAKDKYSVFKGRGRYRKQKEPESTSINAQYVIDPANNNGLDYQYDEVVRNRDARKKLHASDCECCRDYYEAVGPLPTRLQQPLWRSPSRSPQKHLGRPGPSRRQAEIDSHKKAISRHRHNWERPPTPPGYWDIGFPTTQEVSVINAKATEMHRRKKEEVEGEAARGGRYRKKT